MEIMKETKTHIKKKRTQRPRPSTSSSTTTTTTTNSDINFTGTILQNNNDEDVANCLILLAHGQYDQPSRYSHVYECNRGFTSFQALGGHRLTHKKPTHEPSRSTKPLSCNPSGSTTKGPNKVHECSICGSDFTSGQALGGHMRRHRSVMPTADDGLQQKFKKHKTLVLLDLNLPAPIEDDETKFSFRSNDQIIVFSTPSSLVDCHL